MRSSQKCNYQIVHQKNERVKERPTHYRPILNQITSENKTIDQKIEHSRLL